MANKIKKIEQHTPISKVLTVVFVALSIVWLFPIFEVVINSFKENSFVNLNPFALPNEESFVGMANYIKGMTFGNYPFLKSVGYSVYMSIASVALILLMPDDIRYMGRILALALTYGLIGIGICIYILNQGKTFFNREYWKLCIPLALPAVFYSLSDLALGQSDQVMLRQMMGDSVTGIYGLALKFGGVMFTIFTALNNSWVPFFFEDFKNGNHTQVKKQAKNFFHFFTPLVCVFLFF